MLKSNHISIDSITPRSSAARKQLNEEAYFDLRSAAADGRECECTETGTAPQLAGVLGKLVPVAGILRTSDQPNSWETQAIFWAMYCCLQSTASHRRESAFWVHCRLCSQPPSLSPASSHRHFRQVMEHIWVIFTPLSSHYLEKLTFFTFFVRGEEVVIELREYKFFGCNLNWNCQKCFRFWQRIPGQGLRRGHFLKLITLFNQHNKY